MTESLLYSGQLQLLESENLSNNLGATMLPSIFMFFVSRLNISTCQIILAIHSTV